MDQSTVPLFTWSNNKRTAINLGDELLHLYKNLCEINYKLIPVIPYYCLWQTYCVYFHHFPVSGSSQTVPQHVAVGKSTSISKASSAPKSSNFFKWGNRHLLVDGSLSASLALDSGGGILGCSGCFASQSIEFYWQVNLGDKYFVPYVKIVGVTGGENTFVSRTSIMKKSHYSLYLGLKGYWIALWFVIFEGLPSLRVHLSGLLHKKAIICWKISAFLQLSWTGINKKEDQ